LHKSERGESGHQEGLPMDSSKEARELRFELPVPGSRELDPVHFPRPARRLNVAFAQGRASAADTLSPRASMRQRTFVAGSAATTLVQGAETNAQQAQNATGELNAVATSS
jgi:hypothetical protein